MRLSKISLCKNIEIAPNLYAVVCDGSVSRRYPPGPISLGERVAPLT